MTIPIPSGTQVWLATGHTDMRKGFDGLALLVQETLKRDPHGGHLFVFRVFDRVSYALILKALDPVKAGDHFTQPQQ